MGVVFFVLVVKVVLVYFFSLVVVFHLINRGGLSFEHSFKRFLGKGSLDHPRVGNSFREYTRLTKFVFSHGISTFVAAAGVSLHFREYPLLTDRLIYKFLWALRDSLVLQKDKIAYLRGLPPEVEKFQEETLNLTQELYYPMGTVVMGPVRTPRGVVFT